MKVLPILFISVHLTMLFRLFESYLYVRPIGRYIIRKRSSSMPFLDVVRLQSSTPEDIQGHEPVDWKQQWEEIVILRQKYEGPVDTMGADKLASTGLEGSERRFRALVSVMLSPQTRDENTAKAFENLTHMKEHSPFLPSVLERSELELIETAIRPVSFYKTKAKNILTAARRCSQEFNDDIPTKIDDLLTFDGVGPKIAYLTFSIAWGKTEGICVDTHVHRITNRLGWVNTWHKKSNGPESTRKQLESLLPREYWLDVNFLLVGFGQTICSAKLPKCQLCTLRSTCRFYLANSTQNISS